MDSGQWTVDSGFSGGAGSAIVYNVLPRRQNSSREGRVRNRGTDAARRRRLKKVLIPHSCAASGFSLRAAERQRPRRSRRVGAASRAKPGRRTPGKSLARAGQQDNHRLLAFCTRAGILKKCAKKSHLRVFYRKHDAILSSRSWIQSGFDLDGTTARSRAGLFLCPDTGLESDVVAGQSVSFPKCIKQQGNGP